MITISKFRTKLIDLVLQLIVNINHSFFISKLKTDLVNRKYQNSVMSFFPLFFCSKIMGPNPVSQAFEDLCQVLALIIQREFISATVRSQRHFPGDKHRKNHTPYSTVT